MKQIRRGVFETNSSSCHSLTLSSKFNISKEIDYTEFELILGEGQYGWGYERLVSWKDKADYLSIEAIRYNDDNMKNKITEVIHEKYPNCRITFIDSEDDNYGYIDHQSQNEIWEMLEDYNLYDFIFSNSIIEIDNDNR